MQRSRERAKETQSPRAVQKRSETRESSKFAETASPSHFSRPLSHHFPSCALLISFLLQLYAFVCSFSSCSSSLSHPGHKSLAYSSFLFSPRMTGCFRTLRLFSLCDPLHTAITSPRSIFKLHLGFHRDIPHSLRDTSM
jgi:hypothetical protein